MGRLKASGQLEGQRDRSDSGETWYEKKRERKREIKGGEGEKEKEKGKKRSRMAGWRTEMGRAEREIKKIEGCVLSRRR